MNELPPVPRYRRTRDDAASELAEEFHGESNLAGRARYEPLPDAPIEYIKPGVTGVEYPRTPADEIAELEADRSSDEQWKNWTPPLA